MTTTNDEQSMTSFGKPTTDESKSCSTGATTSAGDGYDPLEAMMRVWDKVEDWLDG